EIDAGNRVAGEIVIRRGSPGAGGFPDAALVEDERGDAAFHEPHGEEARSKPTLGAGPVEKDDGRVATPGGRQDEGARERNVAVSECDFALDGRNTGLAQDTSP